ncbi:zinc ribbon domain-containing protein [Deinococcus lacus]|uniref:Zinc ribbon domain-containing protein n=1 Tax=Deinococcus lacus TaxID=392561 RepID=A0ABW1YBI1_9DEIO
MLQERAEEMEEDLLPLQERHSRLSERSAALRAQHRTLRPELETLEAEDERRIEGLRSAGAAMRAERAGLAGSLGRTLKEYELIRRSKKGIGVALLQGGRCSACNVSLPVSVQQRATQDKFPPVKCPSCGRFLIRLTQPA